MPTHANKKSAELAGGCPQSKYPGVDNMPRSSRLKLEPRYFGGFVRSGEVQLVQFHSIPIIL